MVKVASCNTVSGLNGFHLTSGGNGMGNWRGRGPVGTWSFGSIEDGTLARTWSYAPAMTGGVTTPMTSFPMNLTAQSVTIMETAKLALPEKTTDAGVEARTLLAECANPSSPWWTTQADALTCMQLMDRVLWNRMSDPGKFNARGAKSLADIVRAPNQFAGFDHYPNYDPSIVRNIQNMLDISNRDGDARRMAYRAFVEAAINIALGTRIDDPSPGMLAAWKTQNAKSPGPNFKPYKSLLNNTFYYVEKVTTSP